MELRDENIYPDENVLRSVLDNAYDVYAELIEIFKTNDMTYEWKYYRDGKAYLCKVQKKKKTIVWMCAGQGYLQATIYFQDKYMDDVYRLDIHDEIKRKIESTKPVGKSKPCIFKIKDSEILSDFMKVMKFKMACK